MTADDAHEQIQRLEEMRGKLGLDSHHGESHALIHMLRLQEIAALTSIALELREVRRRDTSDAELAHAIERALERAEQPPFEKHLVVHDILREIKSRRA